MPLPAYGPPSLADTASTVFYDHPTFALIAMSLTVLVFGNALAILGGWVHEAWVAATDAVAHRWPHLATIGARWRAEEARRAHAAQAADERRQTMQLLTVLALTIRR